MWNQDIKVEQILQRIRLVVYYFCVSSFFPLSACRLPLADRSVVVGLSADRYLRGTVRLAWVQPHSGGRARLPVPEREGRTVSVPHGRLLHGNCGIARGRVY